MNERVKPHHSHIRMFDRNHLRDYPEEFKCGDFTRDQSQQRAEIGQISTEEAIPLEHADSDVRPKQKFVRRTPLETVESQIDPVAIENRVVRAVKTRFSAESDEHETCIRRAGPSAVVPRLNLSSDTQELSSSKLSVQLLPPAAFETRLMTTEHLPLTPRTDISSVLWPTSNISTTIQHLHDVEDYTCDSLFRNTTEELVHIREQLQVFKQQKEKVKQIKEQRTQLRAWLHHINSTARDGQSSVDTDIVRVEEELYLMENELETLLQQIRQQKPLIVGLVGRAKELTCI